MAKITYIAMLEPAPKGGYGVSFPDLPGCVSFGETLDDAVSNAHEALALHLEGMAADGEALPAASHTGDLIVADGRPAGAVFVGITTETPDGRERVNVYLSSSLLGRVDRFAETTGMENRSTFFNMAARFYLTHNPAISHADFLERLENPVGASTKAPVHRD